MFSVSKKSVLLLIIFFTAFHTQCSEFNNLQVTQRKITFSIDEIPQKEESPLWNVGKLLLPVVGGALANYALQKWNEDPEIVEMKKEEKRIDLAIKQHPDYINIEAQRKKNEIEKEILAVKEKKLEQHLMHANLVKHNQDEWARFRKCETPFTRDFCDHMVNLHQISLNQLMELSNNRS
jgi:hypothetical protein